jgi:uncharacterized OB-fold protein
VSKKGNLLTYTVIHVAPKQFETQVPYPIGVVKLENGLQLLGMIRDVEPHSIKIGMELTFDHEKTTNTETNKPEQWTSWPRYYFKPT